MAWGTENRRIPVRKFASGHHEFRAIDATANLYLNVAAYIAAGLLGVLEEQELVWKDCQMEPSQVESRARQRLGMTTEMSKSLTEALVQFEEDHRGLDQ